MQKTLITLGAIIFLMGVFWPWLSKLTRKLGLFHLPGDIAIEQENFRFYFPLTSMIIISVILSVIIWLLRR